MSELREWIAALWPLFVGVALVLAAREVKIGLAAAGKHVASAMAMGWAPPGLIPKDPEEREPEKAGPSELQGVNIAWLEPQEQDEMAWVDEVISAPGHFTDQDRSEALRLLDYYSRCARDRQEGRTPFAGPGDGELHRSLRAETVSVVA